MLPLKHEVSTTKQPNPAETMWKFKEHIYKSVQT